MAEESKRLGEVLVELGYITRADMQAALSRQAAMKSKKGYALRVGMMMVNEGLIDETQLATALAIHLGTEAIDLADIELEVGLVKDVPQPVFEKHSFIPVRRQKSSITIACDEVLPREILEGLRRVWGSPVEYSIAATSQLSKVRAWCRQHRRRLMQGSLERVTLPRDYFIDKAADPESTIAPGQLTVDALDAAAQRPRLTLAASEAERADRRARRTSGRIRSLQLPAPGPSSAPPQPPEPDPVALDDEVAAHVPAPVPVRAPITLDEPAFIEDSIPPPPAARGPQPAALPSQPAPTDDFPAVEVSTVRLDSVPPLSRLLVALPATLDALLRELRDSACETLTVSPAGHGADVLAGDEDGCRVTGAVGAAEYDEILRRCLELLCTQTIPAVPLTAAPSTTLDGRPFPFRLTLVPSAPPTLAFSTADRDGWAARRQVQQDASLIDALTRRVRQRRGLIVLAGDTAAPVGPTLHGVLAALRRARLRIALYTPGAARVREVTTVPAPPDRLPALTEPRSLLAVAEAGVDLLAFESPLAPELLHRVVPLAAIEAAVLVTMRERDTLEAVSALARERVPPALLASTLELAVSVHRAERICAACRHEVVLTDEKLPPALKGSKLAGATVFEAGGCAACGNTGARGTVALHEVLTWDRAKAGPDLLALDRKSQVKRAYEAGLVAPMTLEARKALLAGTISFNAYLKLLGLTR